VSLYGSGGPDFNTFYLAGESWLSHRNPYLNVAPSPFVYPPTSLSFYGVFALFQIDFASWLWMITYFIIFVIALVALGFMLKDERRSLYVSIAALLFFTSYPLLIMMTLGQSDLLVASLSILSLVGYRLKHSTVSAILLSAATLLKGPPVLLLIYFVLYNRDAKYAVRFVASTVAFVVFSLVTVPFAWYAYYVTNVLPGLSVVSSWYMNQSIVTYVSALGFGKISGAISALGVGLFALFSLFAGRRKSELFHGKSLLGDGMFLMNVLVMLLFGPRSWPATYVWVILPLALFFSSILTEQPRTLYLVLIGLATFLVNSTLVQEFMLATYPLAMFGNLILTVCLSLIYLTPNSIFHAKRD